VAQGDDGTLLTGNLTTMIPTATDLPSFALDRAVKPSPGVRDIDPPCTPEKVRRAVERARTGAGK
jgi:hypothetical protein